MMSNKNLHRHAAPIMLMAAGVFIGSLTVMAYVFGGNAALHKLFNARVVSIRFGGHSFVQITGVNDAQAGMAPAASAGSVTVKTLQNQ